MSRYDLGTAMPAGEGVQADGIVKWFNGSKGFGFVAINNNSSDAFLHISVVTRAGLQGLAENTRLRCMVAPSDRGMQVTHILEVMGVDQNAPQSHGREQRQDSYARDNFSRDNFTRDNFTRDNFSARDHGSGDHRGLSDFGGRDSFSNNSYSNNFDAPPRQQHQPRQATGPEVEVVGSIKWYKTDKGFGFAMPEDGSKDVFIHRSILERVGLDNIDPGRKIRMMVTSSQKGREATRIDLLD